MSSTYPFRYFCTVLLCAPVKREISRTVEPWRDNCSINSVLVSLILFMCFSSARRVSGHNPAGGCSEFKGDKGQHHLLKIAGEWHSHFAVEISVTESRETVCAGVAKHQFYKAVQITERAVCASAPFIFLNPMNIAANVTGKAMERKCFLKSFTCADKIAPRSRQFFPLAKAVLNIAKKDLHYFQPVVGRNVPQLAARLQIGQQIIC